jgi:type IV pilus assembly protein PilY1
MGTGKYLEITDLTTTQKQTIYAIKDDDATSTFVNPRTSLVQQTITTAGSSRTSTNNAVNFTTGRGWFVDLPDSGERQNVSSQLVSGTLLAPTTVPSATVCSPGGTGWLNFLDFKTGGPVTVPPTNTIVSSKTNAPIVGINVIYIPKDPNDPTGPRKPVVRLVTSDKPTPEPPPIPPAFKEGGSAFQQKRVIWRELTQ